MAALFSGRGGNDKRSPAVAGMFYPGSPSTLTEMLDEFLGNVEKRPLEGELVALIVPHAGYIYSGQVAASAYKQIEGMNFDAVILIGVSHRSAIRGASVYGSGGYETPLGIAEVDSDLAGELMAKSDIFTSEPRAHAMEHSLEVQVPFLQHVLPDLKIVPILMGRWSEAVCSSVSEALAETIGDKNILLLASTDMSHYHSYNTARNMDEIALTSVRNMETAQLMDDLGTGNCELCGAGPVITVLMTAEKLGAKAVDILDYANSGDVTGDKSGEVVGYFAAAVYRK